MINRDNIVELAQLESPQGCAVTFYFQPGIPQNKSHREETIAVKDAVRHAIQQSEKSKCAREDLERIMAMAELLHGNARQAKAVYACSAQNFWREYDLPPRLNSTQVTLGRRFRLRPLTAIADTLPRVAIALAGRSTYRLFEFWMDELRETEKVILPVPRRSRSDGFGGYDAGHSERHLDQETMKHFKKLGERLQRATFDRLIMGCRDDVWPELEPYLPANARQRFMGRFSIDPNTATVEQVREEARRVSQQYRERRRGELFTKIFDEAKANSLGALGIKRVLRSIEAGEVQTLLLGEDFAAPACECRNCRHIEPLRTNIACPSCGAKPARSRTWPICCSPPRCGTVSRSYMCRRMGNSRRSATWRRCCASAPTRTPMHCSRPVRGRAFRI